MADEQETAEQAWQRWCTACEMAGTTAAQFAELCSRIAHNAEMLRPARDKWVGTVDAQG